MKRTPWNIKNWMMSAFIVLALQLCALDPAYSARAEEPAPLETVPSLDLNRYLGHWYELASIRHFFEEGCFGSTATYTLKDDGEVDVLNTCHDQSLDGELKETHGTAWIAQADEPAKLKVQFFWPFSADYWVIELGQNYEYAVVGHPTRDYLWILSRTPVMSEELYSSILKRLEAHGYDLSRIEKMPQPAL